MRLAILGTRGIPARYGGFETFAEELGTRLASRGHEVTVYARSHVVPPGIREYGGVRIRVLPTVRHKYFDTVAHTFLSTLDSLVRRFDVVLICNNANAPFAMIPRLSGANVVINVDGLEWQRAKWGSAGRAYYRFCAWLASKLPVVLVSDARVIVDYYAANYGRRTRFIPYGTDVGTVRPASVLDAFGLKEDQYLLYVSRLEPENNAHVVLDAYARAGGASTLGLPLVIVGDAPYATEYKKALERQVEQIAGVILAGSIYGDGYAELQSNASIYVQATEVGGTHPALVEAMGRGRCIVANDVPEHREVLGDAGFYYRRNDATALAATLTRLAADGIQRASAGNSALERARAVYSWEGVTDSYEALFSRLMSTGESR